MNVLITGHFIKLSIMIFYEVDGIRLHFLS